MVSTPGYCFGVQHTILFSYFYLKKYIFLYRQMKLFSLVSEKKKIQVWCEKKICDFI